MKKLWIFLMLAIMVSLLVTDELDARGGRGGGRI